MSKFVGGILFLLVSQASYGAEIRCTAEDGSFPNTTFVIDLKQKTIVEKKTYVSGMPPYPVTVEGQWRLALHEQNSSYLSIYGVENTATTGIGGKFEIVRAQLAGSTVFNEPYYRGSLLVASSTRRVQPSVPMTSLVVCHSFN